MPDEPGSDSVLSSEDRFAAIESRMTQLMNLVTEMIGGDDGDVPVDSVADIGLPAVTAAIGDDEEDEELPIAATASKESAVYLSRIAALEARLAASDEEKAKAVYANGCPIGAKIVLSQAMADLLYPIWRDDPSALDVVKASIVKDEPAVAPQTVPAPIVMTSAWASSGIADDSAAPGGIYTMQAAFDEATTLSQQNKTKHSAELKKLIGRVQEEV